MVYSATSNPETHATFLDEEFPSVILFDSFLPLLEKHKRLCQMAGQEFQVKTYIFKIKKWFKQNQFACNLFYNETFFLELGY